jgi:uncharacterized protein (DUF58 family)
VRTSKGKHFSLRVVVQDEAKACSMLRLGLPFPVELEATETELAIRLHPEGKPVSTDWEILAVERGNLRIDHAYIETASRAGFWDMRHRVPVECEVRVYPDLSREKHVLAPLFFRRGTLGTHQVRQLGKGREFQQLRPYIPGDSYEDIYWKGTAKRRFPVTVMHQIERTQELHVLIDVSSRSGRPLEAPGRALTGEGVRFEPRTQCERFIQAALVLALAAEQQGDRFGMITFSDQVHNTLPAFAGRQAYQTARDALYTLLPRQVGPDFAELFTHVGNRIRQRSLLIVLTDLADPFLGESFCEAVERAARKHVVLVHSLGSKEFQPLFQKRDAVAQADHLYARLAGHMLWSDLADTTRELKQRGVHLTSSLQESLVADVVSSYLKVKRRQLV